VADLMLYEVLPFIGILAKWQRSLAAPLPTPSLSASLLTPAAPLCGSLQGEYHGCLSCNDILKELVSELNAKKPHWMDEGAGAFTADDLLAVGRALTGKAVGELEHGERGMGCQPRVP
jgi:hypothetical protein